MISIIAAVAGNRIIGKGNKLPWKIPADMEHFKNLTDGHTVIMGRKTFESIGRPLPGRKNVVMSRNSNFKAEGCYVIHSAAEALELAGSEEVFVMGGAELYAEFMDYAERMYITLIDEDFDGDAHFPEIDSKIWLMVSKVKGQKDEKNPYEYYFLTYVKRDLSFKTDFDAKNIGEKLENR